MAFLMSTHFPYTFPDEFDTHQPSGEGVTYASWKKFDPKILANRYRNAASFLEDEIVELQKSLDSSRTIFIVTGDHGESLGDDEALGHATRGSEAQCRVPLLVFGGPTPGGVVIDRPTTHADLAPTLLNMLNGKPIPLRYTHGRDVLTDADALQDRVMICPYRWKDPRQLVLVRGHERLMLEMRLNRPEIRVFGPCDEHGRLRLDQAAQADALAADEWAEMFFEELSRVAQ
jgi:membrane-anchored protein YejM (alkaline phosphatase superfamily)